MDAAQATGGVQFTRRITTYHVTFTPLVPKCAALDNKTSVLGIAPKTWMYRRLKSIIVFKANEPKFVRKS